MDLSAITNFFAKFETSRVITTLEKLNLQELVQNPYFLGGTATLAIIAFLMRWRLLLVVILAIAGFVGLFSYTLEQGTSLEGGAANETMMVFIGGGTLIVFLVIYLLFIRSE